MQASTKRNWNTFNKAVRTLMKLNGSTAVDFSALDAEFSALQSGSAELRTQLETLQPDISVLKNIRKYINLVLNKQQLSAPGGKTPERESVLKKLNNSKAALEEKKITAPSKDNSTHIVKGETQMSKTITLTEHRPADGMLTMRVRNTTYNVNIFFNPNAKSTLDTQMRKNHSKRSESW